MASHTFTGNIVSDHAQALFGDQHNTYNVFNQYYSQSRLYGVTTSTRISTFDAIRGLLSVSGHLCASISAFTSRVPNAPSLISSVYEEVSGFRNALQAVSAMLESGHAQSSRITFVPADTVVVSFTGAVRLFDRLEETLRPFLKHKSMGIAARSQWRVNKRAKVTELATRLQWHKDTIVLQLLILQTTSEQDAKDKGEQLRQRTEEILHGDRELADTIFTMDDDLLHRLEEVEHVGEHAGNIAAERLQKGNSLRDLALSEDSTSPGSSFSTHEHLDRMLSATGPYRRLDRKPGQQSVLPDSGSATSGRFSILSAVSLGNVSIMAVVALPIFLAELQNPDHYRSPSKAQDFATSSARFSMQANPPGGNRADTFEATQEAQKARELPEFIKQALRADQGVEEASPGTDKGQDAATPAEESIPEDVEPVEIDMDSLIETKDWPTDLENTSRESIRQLREMMREKYRLDIWVWSHRNYLKADRKYVLEKCLESDALKIEIRSVVDTWEEQLFHPEEWPAASRIKKLLARSEHDPLWKDKPPWERLDKAFDDSSAASKSLTSVAAQPEQEK